MRYVVFNNITAEAENGSLFWGADGTPITGVELNKVHLHMIPPEPDFAESIGGNLDLRWTALSPRDGIIKSDIPAFYAKHVDGLRLRDVQIDWAPSMPVYFSEGIRIETFKDVTMDGLELCQAQLGRGAAIALQDGTGTAITNSRATPGTDVFLHLDRVEGRRVFANYDLGAAATGIEPAKARFDTEITGRSTGTAAALASGAAGAQP